MGLRDDPQSMLRGTPRGGLAAPRDDDGGAARAHAPRRLVDTAAVVVDSLAVEQSQDKRERFVGKPAPLMHVDAEMFVLLSAVADAEGVRDATPADDVQDADLLGQP